MRVSVHVLECELFRCRQNRTEPRLSTRTPLRQNRLTSSTQNQSEPPVPVLVQQTRPSLETVHFKTRCSQLYSSGRQTKPSRTGTEPRSRPHVSQPTQRAPRLRAVPSRTGPDIRTFTEEKMKTENCEIPEGSPARSRQTRLARALLRAARDNLDQSEPSLTHLDRRLTFGSSRDPVAGEKFRRAASRVPNGPGAPRSEQQVWLRPRPAERRPGGAGRPAEPLEPGWEGGSGSGAPSGSGAGRSKGGERTAIRTKFGLNWVRTP